VRGEEHYIRERELRKFSITMTLEFLAKPTQGK